MEYERTKVDGSVFNDLLGGKGEFSMLPELPMIEFKAGKWKIKFTDLRCLNEVAVDVFEKCLTTAATEEGATEAVFYVGDISDEELSLVIDICMGVKFEAKKRGGDFSGGSFLITGAERGDGTLAMKFIQQRAQAIYNYVQSHKKEDETIHISLPDLVCAIIEKEHDEMARYLRGEG